MCALDHSYSLASDHLSLPLVETQPLYSFDCTREGLSYIAGFLAYKLSDEYPDLGTKTSNSSRQQQLKFPWLAALSRGGLIQPSEEFFQQIQVLEKLFNQIHGNEITRNTDVVQSFLNCALKQNLSIHPKICLRFAKTRVFIRLKFLNHLLLKEKGKKRHLRKVGHLIT